MSNFSLSEWRYSTGSSMEVSVGNIINITVNYTVVQIQRIYETNPSLYFRAAGLCAGLGISPTLITANFSLSDFQSMGTQFTNRCPERPFCSRDIRTGNYVVLENLEAGAGLGIYGTALAIIDPTLGFTIAAVRGVCFFAGVNLTMATVSAEACVLRINNSGHPRNLIAGGL